MLVAANLIHMFFEAVTLAIVVRALLSFFPNVPPDHPAARFLDTVTNPFVMPFRRLLPPMGGLDLSPLLAILVLNVLERVILGAAGNLAGSAF